MLRADPAPVITSVTPASGPVAGGTQVSIAVDNLPSTANIDVASIAEGGVGSANASYSTNTPDKAFDSNDATNWTGPGGTNYYIQSTFNKSYLIQKVAWSKCGSDTTPRQAKVQLLQGGTWVDAATLTNATITGNGEQVLTNPIQATAVRMFFTSAGGWVLCSTLSAYKASYEVAVGGVPATNIQYPSATEIRATTPARAAGLADVSIIYDGQTIATSTGAFEYIPPPSADTITPNSGLVTGGDSVTIVGTNFRSGASVTVGGVVATNVVVVNSTTITATVPAHALGKVDVVITNSDGQLTRITKGYRYTSPPPVITSVTPAAGTNFGGTSVKIGGTGFAPPNIASNTWTSAAPKVLPAQIYLAYTAVVGDTIYMFGGYGASPVDTIYSAPVSDPTTWTNTGKKLPTAAYGGQLTVVGDRIYIIGGYNGVGSNDGNYGKSIYSASVSDPTSWTDTGKKLPVGLLNSSLAIIGSNLYLFGGYNTNYVAAIYSATLSDPTSWTSVGTMPQALESATIAVVKDRVYLFGGTYASAQQTAIWSAPISSPASLTVTGNLPTVLSGARLMIVGDSLYMYRAAAVYSASISNPNVWVNSGKTLPASLNGPSIIAVNGTQYVLGGQGSNAIYTSPVSQNRPNQYDKPWLFNWYSDPQDLSNVTFDDLPATSYTVDSPTQITAVTPPHASGTVPVAVVNYDGQSATRQNGYNYVQSATISSITPSNGLVTGGDSVTVSGAFFTPSTSVKFGGTDATQVTFVNDTTLSVITPAHAVGSVDVMVANPGVGGDTLTNGFTYKNSPPSVSSFAPMSGKMSAGNEVTFQGTGFTSGMVAYFDGVAATTTSVTATTLKVTVPTSSVLKDATITIKAPDSAEATLTQKYRYTAESYAITSAPLQLRATQPGTVTVVMRNASGNPITAAYDTDLQLLTSSGGGSFSVDGGTSWGATTLRVPAGQSSGSVLYRDANKGTPTITIRDASNTSVGQLATITSKYSLLVTGITDPIKAGIPSSVTVQAVDYQGNLTSDYTGTIRFSSTDSYASVPANFGITSAMQGRNTFVNGVTMVTTGEQCVTVTDTADSNITGSQCAITVQEGYAGTAKKLAIITDPQSTPVNKSTSALTVQSQDENGNPAPLPVDTTIYVSSSSTGRSFSLDGITGWTNAQPFAVVIKANTTSANVYYKDSDAGNPTVSFKDQPGATDVNLTDTSQQVHIGVGPPARLAMTVPALIPTGSWQQVKVQLNDQDGQAATNPSAALPVYLTSDSGQVRYSTSPSGTNPSTSLTATIPTGANHVMVYVNSLTALTAQLTTSDASPPDGNTGLVDDTRSTTFAVITPNPTQLSITGAASTAADAPVLLTITARDANGNLATSNQDQVISLGSLAVGGTFSKTDNPWQAVSNVTLPANTTSVNIYYKNPNAGQAQLQFQAPFSPLTNYTVTVTPGAYAALVFTAGPNNVPVTEPTQYSVGSRDMYGNSVIASADTPVYLYQTGSTGQFSLSAGGPWNALRTTIPSGSDTAQFFYRDSTLFAASVLAASDQASYDDPDVGIVNATKSVSVVGQTASKLSFTTQAQTVDAGAFTSAMTVQLQKSDGTPAIQDANRTVYLTSDSTGQYSFSETPDTQAATIQSVTIPSGQSSASFYYRDTLAGAHIVQAVSINNVNAAQTVTVQPAALTQLTFMTPPQTVAANQPSAQIQIGATDIYKNLKAVTSDTVVDLSTNCASGSFSLSNTNWQPINQLTLPSGQTSLYVYHKSGEPDCTIKAASAGLTDGSQQFKTYQGPHALSIDGASYTLEAGQTATYTVSLRDAGGNITSAVVDTTVYLDKTNGALNENSIVIRAGTSGSPVTFTAGSAGQASISARDEANVGAPDTGLQNTTRALTVTEGVPVALKLSADTSNMIAGQPLAVRVQLVNAYGSPVTAATDTVVTLSTTSNGFYTADAGGSSPTITTTTIAANSNISTIYYRQTATGLATLTAHNNAYTNGTYNVNVTSNDLASYYITGPQTLQAGQPGNYTIEGRDLYGNTITFQSGQRIYIASNLADAQFSGSDYDPVTHSIRVNSAGTAVPVTYKNTATGNDTITVSYEYPASSTSPVTKATADVTVIAGAPARLAFVTSAPQFERGGVSNPITVAIQNAYGVETKATSAVTVALTSSVSMGKFGSTNSGPWDKTQEVIPVDASRATFYYQDNATTGQFELRATADPLTRATQNGEVLFGAPANVVFTSAPQVLTATHTSQAITAQLYNRFGYPTKATSASSLRLVSGSGAGEFATSPPAWGVTNVPWNSDVSQITFYYRDSQPGTPIISGEFTGLPAATQSVTVVPQVFHHLYVTNISTPQTAGTSSSVVVIAQDSENYTVASYAGTIRFGSTDPEATLPPEYMFNPAVDKGLHTFTNGVRFGTAGTHSVFAVDAVSGASGRQDNIIVYPGSGSGGGTTDPVNPPITPPTDPGQPGGGSGGTTTPGGGSTGSATGEQPSGSGTNNENDQKATGSQAGVTALSGSAKLNDILGKRLTSLIESPVALYVVPSIVYGILLLFILLVLIGMYREIRQARWLAAVLKRERQTAADKSDFLGIASHHVRTPVTIITGASELLASTAANDPQTPVLTAVAARIKEATNDIVSSISTSTTGAAVEQPVTPKRIYLQPLFWLPLVLTVVGTILLNIYIQQVGTQDPSAAAYAYQSMMIIGSAILLYLVVRGRQLRKQRVKVLEAAIAHEQELDGIKNKYISLIAQKFDEAVHELKFLYDHFETTAPVMIRPLGNGITQLEKLVGTMQVLSTINTASLNPQHFLLDDIFDKSEQDLAVTIAEKQLVFTASVAAQGIRLMQDQGLVERVASSVIKNAVDHSPVGAEIEITASESKDDTTITITDTAGGVPKEFTAQPLRPFAHDRDASISEDQHLGLGLYLDALIMRRLGGSINIANIGKGAQVRITLPKNNNSAVYS